MTHFLVRLFAAGSVVTLGPTLAGCGGGGSTTAAPSPSTTAAPSPSTTAAPPIPAPVKLESKTVDIGGDMEFDCIQTAQTCSGSGDKVLLVHGFPLRKEYWTGLMVALFDNGFCALACDMHGYSPGASPEDKSKYQTDAIRTDTFKIAETVGFATFHLIGHDHGAVLGWRMATTDVPANLAMIKTYTAMSIPHLDVFSTALFGDNASEDQVVASQYFSAFVTPKASIDLFNTFKCARYGDCFNTSDDFQKALWWYNGIFEGTAALAMPRDLTIEEIENSTSPGKGSATGIRGGWPELQADGFSQARTIGDISKPTLYVCGKKDPSILCYQEWALKTEDSCTAGYKYVELECEHNLDTCPEEEANKMNNEVVDFLRFSANSAKLHIST